MNQDGNAFNFHCADTPSEFLGELQEVYKQSIGIKDRKLIVIAFAYLQKGTSKRFLIFNTPGYSSGQKLKNSKA